MELFYLRAVERLFIVVSGLVCIVLGYALFRISYSKAGRSDAELVAKGAGFEVTLRHVWPGVFFAAFGMIVLVTSVLTQLKTPISAGPGGVGQGATYQGGGPPPSDSKTRAINAIAAIGHMLVVEPMSTAAGSPQRATVISRLATAQIDLVDVAYGQGSYEKFMDIASKAKTPKEFETLPLGERQFFEDLRTALQR